MNWGKARSLFDALLGRIDEFSATPVIQRHFNTIGLSSVTGMVLLVIAIFYFADYVAKKEERQQLAASIKDTENLAGAFERQAASEISAVERLVLSLKYAVEERDSARMNSLLSTVNQVHDKRVVSAVVVNARGDLVANSLPFSPTNIADLEHFRVHVDHDSQKSFISKPLVGRVSGKWQMHVVRRVNLEGGAFGGIVMTALDLMELSAFYRDMNLGSRGFMLLVGDDDIVRAHQMQSDFSSNNDLRLTWPALHKAIRSGENKGTAVVEGNGRKSIVSYRKVEGYLLTVVVGVDQGELLAGTSNIRRNYLAGALFVSLLALLVVAMMWLLVRLAILRTKERQVAEQRVLDSEQRFRDLTELSSDWWWEQDSSLKFTVIAGTPGQSDADWAAQIGKTSLDLGGELLETTWETHLAQLKAHQPFRNLLIRRDAADGARYFRVSGKPIFDTRGEFAGYRGVTSDVTGQQKLAEATLLASEERYQGLFTVSPFPMWVIDITSSHCLAVNDAALNTYGYSRKEFLGLNPSQLQCPASQEPHDNQREEQRGVIRQRTKHITRSGRPLDVEITSRVITFLGQKARLVIANDITSRVTGEATLREIEKRYQYLFESNPQPMLVTLNDGLCIVEANRAAVNLYGYTLDEFRHMTAHDLRRSEEVSVFVDHIAKRDPTQDLRSEWRHQRKDGTLFEAEVVAHSMQYEGKFARLVMIMDVSERKCIENALKESEERFRAAFDQASVGMGLRAADAKNPRWMRVNPKLCEIFGYSEEELLAISTVDLSLPEERNVAITNNINLLEQNTWGMSREKRYVRKDGSVFWAHINLSPVHDRDGKTAYFVSIIQDITERKAREETLRQQDRAQRRALVREVHHRIKNHIQGAAGLLRVRAQRNPAVAMELESAAAQLRSVAAVHGLQGRGNDSISLEGLILDICESVRGYGDGKVTIQCNAAVGADIVLNEDEAVPVALIVNELLMNALKHTGVDASVQVVSVRLDLLDNNGTCLTVTNPGQLPGNFDWRQRKSTGGGLRIVASLLPAAGAQFDIRQTGDGTVTARLVLYAPVIEVIASRGVNQSAEIGL